MGPPSACPAVMQSVWILWLCCAGGFFAKDIATLQAAAGVLLNPSMRRPTQFKRLLVAMDAFALADTNATEALYQAGSTACCPSFPA